MVTMHPCDTVQDILSLMETFAPLGRAKDSPRLTVIVGCKKVGTNRLTVGFEPTNYTLYGIKS